jgi:hypothetical protein
MVPYCRGKVLHTFAGLSTAATEADAGPGHTSGNSSTSDASNFSFFLLDVSTVSPSPSSCSLLPSETFLSPVLGASMELAPTNDGNVLVLASGLGGVGLRLRTVLSCESGGGVFGVDMLGDKIMRQFRLPATKMFGLSGLSRTFVHSSTAWSFARSCLRALIPFFCLYSCSVSY